MTLFYARQYVTTALLKAGKLTDAETIGIVLQSTDGHDITKVGIVLLSYQDPLDVTIAEWITNTSINASKEIVGLARAQEGTSAELISNPMEIGAGRAYPPVDLSQLAIANYWRIYMHKGFSSNGSEARSVKSSGAAELVSAKLEEIPAAFFTAFDSISGLLLHLRETLAQDDKMIS